MTIVVTGASGQYGRAAVAKLLDRVPAEDLILITRRPEKLADLAARGCVVRRGDFDDPASLAPAFAGGDTMLLISATRVGARVAQHRAAVEGAVAAGVRRIAYTSVVGIGPDNPAIVVRDHGPTEDIIKASGLQWTMLRDGHYTDAMVVNMGPNLVRSGRWLSSTKGTPETLVWRDDCINSAVAVLTGEGHEGRTYNIVGPERISFPEIAAIMTEVTGHPVRYEETDDEGMYAMFDAMGIPREPVDDQSVSGVPWNSDDMVSFERAVREGYFDVVSDDVERLTGRRPRTVRQMIEEQAGMLRAAAA